MRDLWDRQGSTSVFRPIDENGFSDIVVRFLQSELADAGIFANREVEVGRVPGAPVGKRINILINAVRRRRPGGEAFEPITAVIEAKGCWNDDIFTALEAQLVREYMIRLRAQAGIFLVGWFETDKWDPKDGRRRDRAEDVGGRSQGETRGPGCEPSGRDHRAAGRCRVSRSIMTASARSPRCRRGARLKLGPG